LQPLWAGRHSVGGLRTCAKVGNPERPTPANDCRDVRAGRSYGIFCEFCLLLIGRACGSCPRSIPAAETARASRLEYGEKAAELRKFKVCSDGNRVLSLRSSRGERRGSQGMQDQEKAVDKLCMNQSRFVL